MPNVPLKSQNIINALYKNPKIDPEIINAISNMYADLQTVKSNLYGLGRDGNGDLVLDNPAYRNKVGDQEALRITKDGILYLGSQYGVRPDVMMNVLGSIYAVPQWARWKQDAIIAGNGSYVWGTEIFNNTFDLYQRTVGNTRIRITQPGDYLVNASVTLGNLATLGAGATYFIQLSHNGILPKAIHKAFIAACPYNTEMVSAIAMIQTTTKNDYVEVIMASLPGGTADRYGHASTAYSSLEICKVN